MTFQVKSLNSRKGGDQVRMYKTWVKNLKAQVWPWWTCAPGDDTQEFPDAG